MSHRSLLCGLAALALVAAAPAGAEREPVLKQIELPHNYYYREMYLPQLTGGPSALAWSPDGRRLVFSMRGSLWLQDVDSTAARQLTAGPGYDYQPDWSPDGRRVIWSSYAGRQWHQLWITTSAGGGHPVPLSYGEFDITAARWSPDGERIAYVSNEDGDTAIWILDVVGGRKLRLQQDRLQFLRPMGRLDLRVVDASGAPVPARLSVTGSDGRSHAPDSAWIHADDGFDRARADYETHYFHSDGTASLQLPAGEAQVTAWRGLEHGVERRTVRVEADAAQALTIESRPLDLPAGWAKRWASGDVHVHMNYGGAYRNTPARLVAQAGAEDVDFVFNLVVNKEQRIPDIGYFSTQPDAASNERVVLLHAQEFHTGYWGHLGLLGLREHFLLPDYSAHPNTGFASPYPDNATAADLGRGQGAVVGWVHPYDAAPDPAADARLTNALPINVALGKVDYYEVSGFSNYRETQEVWYRLLNCGFRLAAAGGSDTMANYASLRGPVGLNRVYVASAAAAASGGDAATRRDAWLEGLEAGRTMATNGPLLGLQVNGQGPGGEIDLASGAHRLSIDAFLRSIVPVDHLEIVFNGEVVESIDLAEARQAADSTGSVSIDRSGWLLLRAWSEDAHPDVFDRWPYATTNPVFITVGGEPVRSTEDAEYFLAWIERVREHTTASEDYNTDKEKQAVLAHIDAARAAFEKRR